MKYTKEQIETTLVDLLYDLLSYGNQESAIISLEYDDVEKVCNVKLRTHIVEDDDYIGFDGY